MTDTVSCLSTAWYWHQKLWVESGPVTADLTTTVVHSYTLMIK